MKVLIFIILLLFCISCGKQNTRSSDKNVVQVDTLCDVCADSVQFYIKRNIQFTLNKDEFNICEVKVREDETKRILVVEFNNRCLLNSTAFPHIKFNYGTNFIEATNNGFCYAFSFGSRHYFHYTVYFDYNNGNFLLNKIIKEYADWGSPDKDGGITPEIDTILPKSSVNFKTFDIYDYVD